MKSSAPFLRSCAGAGAFLALCLLPYSGVAPVRAAGGASITAFYTTTKAAYDAWGGANSAPPAHTSTFAAGTTNVAYYLAYTGATPNVTHFQIVQRDTKGGVSKGAVHTLHYAGGSFADYFSNQQPAFASGKYTFELLLDGVPVATTHFTIQRGLAVPAFYATTKSTIDAWQKSTSDTPPARTRFFAAGTANIGYYFSFTGATPKATTFHVDIYRASGALFISGDHHTLHYASGYFGNYFYDQPAFPNGVYTMKVTINNQVYKSTAFSVG